MAGKIVWVYGFTPVAAPIYQALRPLLPAFREGTGHLAWAAVLTLLAVAAWRSARQAGPPFGSE